MNTAELSVSMMHGHGRSGAAQHAATQTSDGRRSQKMPAGLRNSRPIEQPRCADGRERPRYVDYGFTVSWVARGGVTARLRSGGPDR